VVQKSYTSLVLNHTVHNTRDHITTCYTKGWVLHIHTPTNRVVCE